MCARLAACDFLVHLRLLERLPVCWFAVDEPILRRLVEVVATRCTIAVNECGLIRKVADEKVLPCVWVLDDEPDATNVAHCEHLQCQLVEVRPIL